MNILIIGSGGREHALAWKIKQSPLCDQLYIAPGNAGTAGEGINVAIKTTDFNALANFCVTNNVEMVIVGPEEPLVKGIYNFFADNDATRNIKVIGPSKEAARLEGSKAFAKEFMQKNNIPTAAYKEFSLNNYLDGIEYIKGHALPVVLKADGLAAGKGVVICNSHIEALAEFELMLQQAKFGEASKKVVIEAFLDGIELSVFVLTDGEQYLLLPAAKDYKRIGNGDTGPNTGGMGAVSPVPFADNIFLEKVTNAIIKPTIAGLKNDQLVYKGVLFIGLIKVNDDPFVIEYNCRFGDPETEVVIPRIENDLVDVFNAVFLGGLQRMDLKVNPLAAATIVAVSGGYPNDYVKGEKIMGLEEYQMNDTIIFHSGTIAAGNDVLTNGGRVLAVTSFGDTIIDASAQSHYVLDQLFFESIYYRDDIGFEFK